MDKLQSRINTGGQAWVSSLKQQEQQARANPAPSLFPTATPSPTPMPTAMPTPSPMPHQGFRLSVPSSDTANGMIDVPPQVAQMLGNEFDKYGTATEAAQVLHHPMATTYTQGEIPRGPNRGENPEFQMTDLDRTNPDGSIDRGAMRINSTTYSDMWRMPYWKQKMINSGITSWDSMLDPTLNMRMAYLRGEMARMSGQARWQPWVAAPKELRQ